MVVEHEIALCGYKKPWKRNEAADVNLHDRTEVVDGKMDLVSMKTIDTERMLPLM